MRLLKSAGTVLTTRMVLSKLGRLVTQIHL